MNLNALVNSFFFTYTFTFWLFFSNHTHVTIFSILYFNNNSTHVNSFINSTCIFDYNSCVIEVIMSAFGDFSTTFLV